MWYGSESGCKPGGPTTYPTGKQWNSSLSAKLDRELDFVPPIAGDLTQVKEKDR